MGDKLFRKGLVVGIIFLFVGAGVYPVIAFKINLSSNSIINTSDELIEFPVQIFGFNSVKSYKISITKQQYDDFQVLIERFKEDFENADTMKESVRVYGDMVVSLNELGLLPKDMSIRDAEKLVMGPYYYLDKLGLLSDETRNEELLTHTYGFYENKRCLLSSVATYTHWDYFWLDYGYSDVEYEDIPLCKSHGWIQTKSLTKNWRYEGEFYGDLGKFGIPGWGYNWVGAHRFFGIYYFRTNFALGYAGHVRIRY